MDAVAPRTVCLFDFDGTIAMSEDLHRRNFERVLKMDIDEHTWEKDCVGKTEQENLLRMKRDSDSRSLEELLVERKQLLNEMIENGELVFTPGVQKLLDTFRGSGVRTAVVSSNCREFIEKALEKGGLAHYFELLVCGDDCAVQGRTKPNPYPYLYAAEQLGVTADRCVVVEDSMSGIKSGLNAGMPVVVIANGVNVGLEQTPLPGVVRRIVDFTTFPLNLFGCCGFAS
eukprot:TRINITY_DN22452_c0_g1_i1.p1 TRINITY_DN22452_c0_g1~~TRINITY_DN22452_c0_g1_i1.p1  ORF type:complete len:238 (+),score=27.18 TRINITY_DN22452_c0_g1_i1:29-715(+)